MNAHHRLLALVFCCLLPLQLHAEAPVVDDSENFAILDEQQQAALQQPVAKAQFDNAMSEDEIPLAKDDFADNNVADNADLLDKIQGMKQEIQELRGQLDVQNHEMKLLQQQQLSFYKDLDGRLRTTAANPVAQATTPTNKELALALPTVKGPESTPASGLAASKTLAQPDKAVSAAVVVNPSRNNPADEQIAYLAAYDLVKNKRYDEALVAMQNFVVQYPKGGYTANAQYWLGELYMVNKNYSQAITHFEVVLKHFPTSSKAAACSLKIGYALAASGKEPEASQRLKDVIKNFPDTPTAQLAAAKLRSLTTI